MPGRVSGGPNPKLGYFAPQTAQRRLSYSSSQAGVGPGGIGGVSATGREAIRLPLPRAAAAGTAPDDHANPPPDLPRGYPQEMRTVWRVPAGSWRGKL
jgi:hypothetical protein